MRIRCNFTLIDNAILMVMEEFDRIFYRKDVIVPIDVDLIDHGCKRRRFSGAGRPGHKYQAARLLAHILYYRRQAERFEGLDLIWDSTEHRPNGTLLIEKVGAEPGHSL